MAQNEVSKIVSQGYVSQSTVVSGAFIRNVRITQKPKDLVLPIKIHDTQSSYQDPFEEELITSKPTYFRIVCQEYVLNRFAGDMMLSCSEDYLRPVIVCLELKSKGPATAFKQALRLSDYTRSWYDIYDCRVDQNREPVEVYSVGITPNGLRHDMPDGPMLDAMLEWFAAFQKKCGVEQSPGTIIKVR